MWKTQKGRRTKSACQEQMLSGMCRGLSRGCSALQPWTLTMGRRTVTADPTGHRPQGPGAQADPASQLCCAPPSFPSGSSSEQPRTCSRLHHRQSQSLAHGGRWSQPQLSGTILGLQDQTVWGCLPSNDTAALQACCLPSGEIKI